MAQEHADHFIIQFPFLIIKVMDYLTNPFHKHSWDLAMVLIVIRQNFNPLIILSLTIVSPKVFFLFIQDNGFFI